MMSRTNIQPSRQRDRHTLDASGVTLGRVATQIAGFLRGKHKATFVPHIDCGDFVHVNNLSGVRFTGAKLEDKLIRHHTGYPGGLKSEKLGDRWKRNPELVLRDAVYNMLPSNALREGMLRRLTVSL